MEKLQLFTLADMQGRPQEMLRLKDDKGFYCHWTTPLPEQVVIMAKGTWPKDKELCIKLVVPPRGLTDVGWLTSTCRCMMWFTKSNKENIPFDTEEPSHQAIMVVASKGVLSSNRRIELAHLLHQSSVIATAPTELQTTVERLIMGLVPLGGPALQPLEPGPCSQTSGAASASESMSSTPPAQQSDEESSSEEMLVADSSAAQEDAVAESSLSTKLSSKAGEGEDLQAVNETTPQVEVAMSAAKKSRRGQGKRGRKAASPDTPTTTVGKKKRSNSSDSPSEDPTPIKRKNSTASKATARESGTTPSKGSCQEGRKRTLAKDIHYSPVASSSFSSDRTGPRTWSARCKDVTFRAGPLPSNRWGHTMVWVGAQQVVMIGGQGDRQQLAKDSIWSLATDTRRWKAMDVTSDSQKPECRMGHTATYDFTLRCIYVYGGSKNLKWFHDVHMFDMDKMTWQLMKVNGKAPMRAYHSATLHRHELWVFGGVYPRPSPNPDGCSNELHIFSPISENWYAPLVTGDKPDPRSGHSANLIEDRLVVFGGWDFPICFNDLHVLDMTTLDWSKPVTQGAPPKPRSWHGSSVVSNQRILIHGGYDGDNALDDCFIFTLKTMTWTQISVMGAPIPRAGHTTLCLPYTIDNEEEDEVLLFGGGDNDGTFFNDLYSLYLPFDPTPALPAPTPTSASTSKQAA